MSELFFVVAGFQKCASTWLHGCLQEHQAISMPELHMIHYFDIHYDRGASWYDGFFTSTANARVRGDSTVTYARSEEAMKRIAKYDRDTRVILILRNPIDRAWSHYWHERKKKKIAFAFEEWESNYDLFSDWILPGMYDQHLVVAESIFGKRQVLAILHDDICTQPNHVLEDVYRFLDVDSTFCPTLASKKRNTTVIKSGGTATAAILKYITHKSEDRLYRAGPSEQTVRSLKKLYAPVIKALEIRFDRNLSHWLSPSK